MVRIFVAIVHFNFNLSKAWAGVSQNAFNLIFNDEWCQAIFYKHIRHPHLFGEEKTLVQFSLVGQSCPTLCDPMSCSMSGLPVHHQLPEYTQTHVHSVSDAIQPSHPLSSPSPPALNLSQHQGIFQ